MNKQKLIGLGEVPAQYQVRHVTSSSGTISVDGDEISGTTYQMNVYDTTVLVNLSGSDTATIQLPSIAEAEGITYMIRAVVDGGGVTITDQDDSLEWTDLTTDADGEYALIKAQGGQWIVLATDIS